MTERSALPPMDVASRLGRLRGSFVGAGCDALLVTNLTNVRYLTGFTGSAGSLLVRRDDAVLFTDGRYQTQSVEQLSSTGADVSVEIGGLAEQLQALVRCASGIARIGLEAGHATWAAQRSYATSLSSVELVPTEGMVESLRRVKDDGELARIERACGIADEALASVRKTLLDLPTEREFALELDFAMRRLGASDVSFETIVASGPNGAKPHARPSDRHIEAGELIVLDFGALVDGYHSDMTRTVCVGESSSSRLAEIVEVVRGAQQAGVDAVRPGIGAKEVDDVCRGFIADAGYGERFVHGTGHGVGLDIHEFPILSQVATASLDAGFVVTVEPGVYLPEEGGVRIEDSVVVTADGCRPLTHAPKDLVIA
jgi:Xaa-Pro aminopeptidase